MPTDDDTTTKPDLNAADQRVSRELASALWLALNPEIARSDDKAARRASWEAERQHLGQIARRITRRLAARGVEFQITDTQGAEHSDGQDETGL